MLEKINKKEEIKNEEVKLPDFLTENDPFLLNHLIRTGSLSVITD